MTTDVAKINLEYYKDVDNYCYYMLNNLDDEMKELLKNRENDAAVKEKNQQLYYYLLDEKNTGLLNWINNIHGNILEITGGLGLHTEMLCKKAESVTTVCFSKVNAEIIESRLSNYDNLNIMVGNFREMNIDKKFDFIIMSDLFEFAKALFGSEYSFVAHLKNMLTENGTLILAVSNKYGLGNFSGSFSHITGQPFDEINNYPKYPFLSSYTKLALRNIFRNTGFNDVKYYYPLPNHYENDVILSEKSIIKAKIGTKIPTLYKEYGNNPNRLIDEYQAVREAIFDNRFESAVNSYLIIAKMGESIDSLPYYAQYNNGIMTTLTDDSCVKTALNDEGHQALNRMEELYHSETQRMEEQDIHNIRYARPERHENSLVMEFAKGTALNQIGLDILFNPNQFIAFGMEYKSLINKLYPRQIYQNYKIDDVELENVACVENANIDLYLSNIFKDGENYTITDYGNTTELIPLNYLVAQGIFAFSGDAGLTINEVEYLKQLGLSEQEINSYKVLYTKNTNKD